LEDIPKDPQARKVWKEAEWLADDLEHFDGRRYRLEEIRKRPSRKDDDRMSRMERDMADIRGFHIDNDELKNVVEDMENLWEDFEEFMDPKSPLQAKGIELDAKLRFSPNVQKLLKMIMDDFNIHSEKDLEKAVEKIAMHIGKDLAGCPYYRRARLSGERMVRYAMKNVKISDLPKGARMSWVNGIAEDLRNIFRGQNNVEDLEKYVARYVEEFLHEVGRYLQEVEKIEQTYNKNGGI